MPSQNGVETRAFGTSFSCPRSLSSQSWATMQQALLRMVLKRVQRAVAADHHCRELQAFYESLLLPICEKVASKDLWLPELGFVLALCKSGRADTACAQLGLALFALVDEPAEWSVRFVQGSEILFAGSIIPVDGKLSARFE